MDNNFFFNNKNTTYFNDLNSETIFHTLNTKKHKACDFFVNKRFNLRKILNKTNLNFSMINFLFFGSSFSFLFKYNHNLNSFYIKEFKNNLIILNVNYFFNR